MRTPVEQAAESSTLPAMEWDDAQKIVAVGPDSQMDAARSIGPVAPSTAFMWIAGLSLGVQDLVQPALIPPQHPSFIPLPAVPNSNSFQSPPLPAATVPMASSSTQALTPESVTPPDSLSTHPTLLVSAPSVSGDQVTPSNVTASPGLFAPSLTIALPSPASTSSSAAPTTPVDHFALCLPRPLSWSTPEQPQRQTDPSPSNPLPPSMSVTAAPDIAAAAGVEEVKEGQSSAVQGEDLSGSSIPGPNDTDSTPLVAGPSTQVQNLVHPQSAQTAAPAPKTIKEKILGVNKAFGKSAKGKSKQKEEDDEEAELAAWMAQRGNR